MNVHAHASVMHIFLRTRTTVPRTLDDVTCETSFLQEVFGTRRFLSVRYVFKVWATSPVGALLNGVPSLMWIDTNPHNSIFSLLPVIAK